MRTWGPECPWCSQPASSPSTVSLQQVVRSKILMHRNKEKGTEQEGREVLGKQAALRMFTEAEGTRRESLGPWTACCSAQGHLPCHSLQVASILRKSGLWGGGRLSSLSEDFTGPAAQFEFSLQVMADRSNIATVKGKSGADLTACRTGPREEAASSPHCACAPFPSLPCSSQLAEEMYHFWT